MRNAGLSVMAVVWFACGGRAPAPGPAPLGNQGPAASPPFSVELDRSQCMGMCPAYTVLLRDDGSVRWKGLANVTATGDRTAHVDPTKVEAVREAFDRARFMELDDSGRLPRGPQCHALPDGSQECEAEGATMCTDTSHAKLTVIENGKTHATDDAHCGGEAALEQLEELVDQTAGTAAWIGTGAR